MKKARWFLVIVALVLFGWFVYVENNNGPTCHYGDSSQGCTSPLEGFGS